MTRRLLVPAFIIAAASLIRAVDTPADLFVAPGGNDSWSGGLAEPNSHRTDGPLASLDAARLKVREIRTQSPNGGKDLLVMLRGGLYALPTTVTFTADDGGQAATTTYAAYPNETPVLSGGRVITGWTVQPDGRWTVMLADVRAGTWNFSQLFVNGQRRMRPRAPSKGYANIAARVRSRDARSNLGDESFRYADRDILPDWKNLSDVEVMAFHPWFTSMLRIKSVDAESRLVTLTGRTGSSANYGQLATGMRYLVDNVAEALDHPGEWYLDRTSGVLTYFPMPRETPLKTEVIAPRLGTLVTLEGANNGTPITNLNFSGLTFAHANWLTPSDGSSILQAASSVNGAVSATNARNLQFVGCTFTQLGTYGLEVGHGCADVQVRDCRFIDLGAGGIKIGTMSLPSNDDSLVRSVVVKNNLITHLGRIHPGAVGVWIGQASDVSVEHNDIYDLYYTGISSGWTWGYQPTRNGGIQIRYNDIHDIGQGVLSDMAGIYTLGASPNTVLEFNRIHDITRHRYGAWGIYFDEGSAGYVARNNLLYRVQDGGFHQHYGEDNRFENNVILDSTEVAWGPTRLDSTQSPGSVRQKPAFTFQRNIISRWGAASVVRPEVAGPLFMRHPELLSVDHNLYWNGRSKPRFERMTLDAWRGVGHDVHSIVTNPKLGNPDAVTFRVPEHSPAVALGFTPFDISTAGRAAREPASLDKERWPRWYPFP